MSTFLYQRNLDSGPLKECLGRAMAERDDEYVMDFVTLELMVVFDLGRYRAAVEATRLVASYDNADVQDAIADLLIRARRHDPEYVEDLLLRGEYLPEVQARVMASPASETVGDLLSYQLATIIYDLFILGPEELRIEMQWLIQHLLEMSDVKEWLMLIPKEFLNLIAGELVFAVPEDAPSRRLYG
jgi:hypothetical protein